MRAAIYETFEGPVTLRSVDDPTPPAHGVVLGVKATGVCRSDWHGWMGHDSDITLPHVPGHEIAGVVEAVGRDVNNWQVGDRVTLPFVCGCGRCPQCERGDEQVCDHQTQPGFTHWGSYAEYVAIHHADLNLVRLPESMTYVTAASLGCRFATSFRAVVAQGKVEPGQWVAVFGCGGVGLSAVMIAAAFGAQVLAIDVSGPALEFATSIGAVKTLKSSGMSGNADISEAVRELTDGGAHVAIDALGSAATCFQAISGLRKRGRHVQVGLLTGAERHPPVPMDRVVAHELEIVGSHGLQARVYPQMLAMIDEGRLSPERLIGRTIDLETAAATLGNAENPHGPGVTVIDRF